MREVIALAIMHFLEMETMCDAYLEEADAIMEAIRLAPEELKNEIR